MRPVAVSVFLMGLVALTVNAAPAPDPASWKPASITGPALFTGEVTDIEEFRNPPGVDYACHAVTSGPHKNQSSCLSNACGLERITLKTEQALQGPVPSKVTLNHIVGEWCKGVSVSGRRFLIAILPGGEWAAFEVIGDNGRTLALPDIGGCLGKVDVAALLDKSGVELGSAIGPTMDWRKEWTLAIGGDCTAWMPESLDKKALPLDSLIGAWKATY